jgi:hypothetical protein
LSPRIRPKLPPDVEAGERTASRVRARLGTDDAAGDPYAAQVDRALYAFDPGAGEHRAVGEIKPSQKVPSYFEDLLLEAESRQRADKAITSWAYRGRDPGDPDRPDADVELPRALERLERVRLGAYRPTRNISGSSGSFLPGSGGVPGYVAEAFSTAAHGKAPLAERLISRPHPGSLKVSTPRIVNGAATNVQTAEGGAVQETDPSSTLAEVPTATIAGQLDLSRQLYDFSLPGSDEWVAAELGADYASKLEIQLISGTGSAGQLAGLRNVGTGSTSVSKANGSPTFSTNLAAIGDLVSQTAAAYGGQPDDLLLVMHPKRYDWIVSKAAFAPRFPVPEENIILSTGIPTNLGAGTNQDVVLALVRSEVLLYQRPVQFRVYPDVGSSTLTVRISAWGYSALLATASPQRLESSGEPSSPARCSDGSHRKLRGRR